ncbi:MAG: hypothetical protein P4N59_09000 [Negativicutes bacterium]|nr:hypothetical protein [Negativicutes bacterium]
MEAILNEYLGLFVVVLPVVVSGIVALAVWYFTNRALVLKNRDDRLSQFARTYKELITSERIKLFNLSRESMAEYLAKAFFVAKKAGSNEDGKDGLYSEFLKAGYLITLLLNQPKHENLLTEMDLLNHNLGDLILLEQVDETHFKETIAVISAFSRSCQALLKDEWRFIECEANPLDGK